jgi:hypothetical protein
LGRFVVRPTHGGDQNLRRRKNHLQRKQKTGPTESNSVCLSSDASRARRRVGVLWGFGRNSGCRASRDHHIPRFVIHVASCFGSRDCRGVRAVLGLKPSASRRSSPAPACSIRVLGRYWLRRFSRLRSTRRGTEVGPAAILVISAFYAVLAPYRQRDEARAMVIELTAVAPFANV